MSISTRYRTLAADTRTLKEKLIASSQELPDGAEREIDKAIEGLESLVEQVGEIPQFKLERELTPVLMRAHGALDRGRLLFEGADDQDNAERIWDMEQQIYRLLNDL